MTQITELSHKLVVIALELDIDDRCPRIIIESFKGKFFWRFLLLCHIHKGSHGLMRRL